MRGRRVGRHQHRHLDPARRRDTPGFGLGLATVQRLVDLEGGTLTLTNRPTGGLSAEIVLPA